MSSVVVHTRCCLYQDTDHLPHTARPTPDGRGRYDLADSDFGRAFWVGWYLRHHPLTSIPTGKGGRWIYTLSIRQLLNPGDCDKNPDPRFRVQIY